MNIVIIPGFMGHSEEVTFKDLRSQLEADGHSMEIVDWPYLPSDMSRYSMSATIDHARKLLQNYNPQETILAGFSMGGVIATILAAEFRPAKLILAVSPYQVGSPEDIAGKYAGWMQAGERAVTSSRFGEVTVPFSFVTDAQQYDALAAAEEVECPLLFLVAERDEKTSRTILVRLYDAFHSPKTWRVLPGAQHKYQYQADCLAAANGFIREFINAEEACAGTV